MLICINNAYCPTTDTFASVAEFLAMCLTCFGEPPTLTYQPGNSRWIDESGAVVLIES